MLIGHFFPGVYHVVISVPEELVVVDTVLKTSNVQTLLKSTGLPTFFKGFGSVKRGLSHIFPF